MNRSFVKWIKVDCSPEKEEYWNSWIEEHPDHRLQARKAKEIISAIKAKYEIPDPETELNKLNQKIDQYEGQRNQFRKNKPRRLYRRSGPIAAGLLFLIVLFGSVYTSLNYPVDSENSEVPEVTTVEEFKTDFGEKLTFRLSDDSRIILNGNSNLKFSSKIEKGLNTEVWLEGEAYFDITHLKDEQQRTFSVHTPDGTISVLGTRFAVNTFGDKTQAVLEEGKINVQLIDGSPDTPTEYLMRTGELARFTANDNKITIQKVNTLVYTSWTDDKLIFEQTPMEEVARRIEDTFGVEVVMDETLAKESLSGSIKSNNLDVLAEALTEILDVTIKKQGQRLFVDQKTRIND